MNIKVYSSPMCGSCRILKDYLDMNGVKYKDINVMEDSLQADYIIEKSGQSTIPQIEIDGELIVGFDKKLIDKKLGIS
jgi:glutaredoxin-like YruB-family protein